jgi:hypothetical protein
LTTSKGFVATAETKPEGQHRQKRSGLHACATINRGWLTRCKPANELAAVACSQKQQKESATHPHDSNRTCSVPSLPIGDVLLGVLVRLPPSLREARIHNVE